MQKTKSEHEIQNEIRLAITKNNLGISFRANVGNFRTQDGRWVSTGLPNGFPDLFGFTKQGKFFAIEVKDAKGQPRADQIRFHNFLLKEKIIHGIARSADDAIKILQGGLIGYGY